MRKNKKDSETAELDAGGRPKNTISEHIRADSPSSLPRESIETWLQGTADTTVNASTPSRKRKHSNSSVVTPSPPPEISESYLNLGEVEFKMPPKTGSDYPTTPSNSKTVKSKASKRPASANDIKVRLEQHHMYEDDDVTFDKYTNFKKKVLEIVGGDRHSPPRAESVSRFIDKQKYLRHSNESSLLDNLIPMIIKDTRKVRQQPLTMDNLTNESSHKALNPQEAQSNTEEEWLVKDFWDSGCVRLGNIDFRSNSLPIPDDLAAMMSKGNEKEKAMTNPRPDYVYGLSCRHFTPPKKITISQETQRIREIVPLLYDPMLVIEGKSDKGEAAEAENQACRSGAALVNAARIMRERIEEKDVNGADERTFVFSGTLCPDHMELWVHWAEVIYTTASGEIVEEINEGVDNNKEGPKTKHVNFHMNLLKSGSLRGDNFLKTFRTYCHNILDWGCITRYEQNLKRFYEAIYTWEAKQLEQRKQTEKEQQEAQPEPAKTPSKSSYSPQTGAKRQRTEENR